MKALILMGAAALALTACGTDGMFKSPAQMTQDERCMNAELALALMEANGVGPQTMARAKANVDVICGPEPLPRP